ncbi:transporter substrate-binding domain-containing protein [Burkholderia sp. Ac-20344]|uniref:transporter substrate-binding domain-containing protein n=1 Tax=Burkholderia sp. Ac-20344 TaxID=2703890 RepID=UPI00197C88E8|nr:transporter substrate-binding domain-containing protein [Burkholderia sp. Ac-20344]MBN3837056.1 transporter substrate-binding domain-containing protein [Burkholderia sp. Ac-20344]
MTARVSSDERAAAPYRPPPHDPKTLGVGSAIGVRKDDDALCTQINQALANLIQDGTYQRIAKPYFSFDIYN